MLSEIAIIKINKILKLVDSYTLNQSEINKLNAGYSDPQTECDYYSISNKTLIYRSSFDVSQNNSIKKLSILSSSNGCEIKVVDEIIPEIKIPFFAISL